MPTKRNTAVAEAPVEAVLKPAPRKRASRKKPEVEPETVRENVLPRISVIIPAYNEAERLPPTLADAHAYFAGREEPFEIIVVDDGSTDRTAEIVERMGADIPQLRLVRQSENAGKGAAVAAGMLAASGAIRLFADADGSTPFEEFAKLEAAIAEGADVAFGSRAVKESEVTPQPLVRVILGRGSNLVIQVTNLPGVWDSQCGFKAFTADAADAIFPHLQMTRWGFDIEILVLARRLGLKLAEVGVRWEDKAGSNLGLFRPQAYLQTLWEDLRIRYNAMTGRYPRRPRTP